ncbi:hypothetical protein ZIOFF_066578 [Zingiber officinale]|uniref:BHLH domain-containing protein n=1 Tax=Zingiber officinale TaxID=94328 RepID=A0A8J5EYS5_ZINOF|nr:hypothetical protein ZIOFF_066578 [Zingiber officinale]
MPCAFTSLAFADQITGSLVPGFHPSGGLQGLHNIHGSFNLPNVPGSLSSIEAAMGVMPHGSGVTNREGINVVGNHAFSSSNINGVTGSITGIYSSSASGNRSFVLGLGVSPVLGNVGPRLTSSVGNIVGSGNMGRSIHSGGLSVPGLASQGTSVLAILGFPYQHQQAPLPKSSRESDTTNTVGTAMASQKKKRKSRDAACLSFEQDNETQDPKIDTVGKAEKKSEASSGYIHVRARRGEATDSHSLAERVVFETCMVRREKISQRMKLLQGLVPGCDKVTGKALMLDEIINYVQTMQHQVEFLTMKLALASPRFHHLGEELTGTVDQHQRTWNVPQTSRPGRSVPIHLAAPDEVPVMDNSGQLLLMQGQGPMPPFLQDDCTDLLLQVAEQGQELLSQGNSSCAIPVCGSILRNFDEQRG